MAHPAIAFLHGPRAPSSSWTVTQNHAVRDFLRIREDNGSGARRKRAFIVNFAHSRTGPAGAGSSSATSCSWKGLTDHVPHTREPRSGQHHMRRLTPLFGAVGSGGSLTPEGRTNQKFRPLNSDDFAANHRFVDTSGNPEKKSVIAALLPGVKLDKLCKEVPDVLLWSSEELSARVEVLKEAMPGHDVIKAISEAPTILIGTPYLKKALERLAELFPGKTLEELLPRYMDATLGTAPRALEYPKRLDWEVPYLDPGLMGNYSVKAELVQAMRDSQHLVFGLWKEDEEALTKFVAAVRRAVLAFETRVFFLQHHYPKAHFER